jgi:hypothetical protein
MLMIGGSLLFLRARPGEHERVHVTERGVPEGENDSVAVVPLPEKLPVTDSARGERAHGVDDGARRDRPAEAEPPSGASPDPKLEPAPVATAGAYDEAMGAYRAHRYEESRQRFDSIAAEAGANAASAALYAALSLKKESGCAAATTRFEDISRRFSGTSEGNEATLQAADCQRSQGRIADARRNYESMTSIGGFSDRARQAIAEMDQSMLASRKARAAPKAPPPTAAASRKAATSQTLDALDAK